jgi:hypothetical protein
MEKINAEVRPEGSLEILSKKEIARLSDTGAGGLYSLFRVCALAVLNAGAGTDDTRQILEMNRDFAVEFIQEHRGLKLALKNAPGHAFVDGKMIRGIREHLFAVLRDLVYIAGQIRTGVFDLTSSAGITDTIFHILRNANLLDPPAAPNMVVCWGGHAISREEYDYSKQVGYHLGLRGLNVCTGCGPGAMKGPMKGAAIGHAKQRIQAGKYVGITEPTIIAAESPNPIVNQLVIMPDMEKRLEAFVRFGHAMVVFPGGVGTAEEILFLLGILLHPDNKDLPFPLILTGPAASSDYFTRIDRFIDATLGDQARSRYTIIMDDPITVARTVNVGLRGIEADRRGHNDAFAYNWRLRIDRAYQQPFSATHDNMGNLEISKAGGIHHLAVNLRRAFSGIVAGNVREEGIRAVEQHGPFAIHGDRAIMEQLDALLAAFVQQNRMKLPGKRYEPCYRIILY